MVRPRTRRSVAARPLGLGECSGRKGRWGGRSGLEAADARSRSAAESVLADAAARVRAEADVDVLTELVEGDAAQALLDRSARADLLVVGARGLGGFAGLLLGSVSQRCVQHAACPVVVVPQS